MYVLLSTALNVSRRQMIAPVPLGTVALSSSLNAPMICVGGLMLFLIFDGVQLTVALHNQVDLVAVLVPVIMQQTILGTVAVGFYNFRHNIVF